MVYKSGKTHSSYVHHIESVWKIRLVSFNTTSNRSDLRKFITYNFENCTTLLNPPHYTKQSVCSQRFKLLANTLWSDGGEELAFR